jgi:hypothetical protein
MGIATIQLLEREQRCHAAFESPSRVRHDREQLLAHFRIAASSQHFPLGM